MRRVLRITEAPIFRSLERMLAVVALARSLSDFKPTMNDKMVSS